MKHSAFMACLVVAGLSVAGNALADDPSGVQTEVKVRDLNKNPDKFSGQDVMVSGKVNRLEGSTAFILEGSGLLNNKILVVVASPAGAPGQQPGVAAPAPVIKEKEKVQLHGRVEDIGVTKIEQGYSITLKPEIKAEFEGVMPVLVVPPSGIKVMG